MGLRHRVPAPAAHHPIVTAREQRSCVAPCDARDAVARMAEPLVSGALRQRLQLMELRGGPDAERAVHAAARQALLRLRVCQGEDVMRAVELVGLGVVGLVVLLPLPPLTSDLGVRECASFGLEDPNTARGEVVCIAVVPSAGKLRLSDLKSVLKSRWGLAGYKRPRRFYQLDELPRNSSGKVVKDALRLKFGGRSRL